MTNLSTNNLLFAAGTTKQANTVAQGATQALTLIANKIAENVLARVSADLEKYGELFEESKSSHIAMDDLLKELDVYSGIDTEFLANLDKDTANRMLKSQQSKRSRAKNSDEMTLDNYKNMLVGAICENTIRAACNMPKTHTMLGGRSGKSLLEYTPEEIQALGEDQEALRRAIRNVQSQKCVMKQKDDFDELDERFQSLLKIEAVLKDMRVATPTVRVDKTKERIKAALAEHDVEHLKAADSKELLKMIANIINGEEAEETTTEEEFVDTVDEEEAADNE